MALDLIYPTSAQIEKSAQDKFPRLTAEREVFKFFPLATMDADELIWERIDNYTGLQQGRGLEAPPPVVQAAGLQRFQDNPGYYGEHLDILESEMTRRRQIGTFATPIDLTELVARRQEQLLLRRRDRQEKNIWDMLIAGQISVPNINNVLIDSHAYLRQTAFATGAPWSNAALSTPLADFRAIKLLARGHSVDFGSGAVAYMNQFTANELLVNTNAADIYGRRNTGLSTYNNMTEVNQLLLGDDLPSIKIYDESYLLDGSVVSGAPNFTQFGQFNLFIPNDTIVVIGRRPNNEPVGNYYETRNAQNPGGAPGAYMYVADNINSFNRTPRKVAIHDGHNGFPSLRFSSAVCILDVS